MTKLEQLVPETEVAGIEQYPVKIIETRWHGRSMLEVAYRNEKGKLIQSYLFRADEKKLKINPDNQQPSALITKLLLETLRIQSAKNSDPFLAVSTSGIQPLPHQISAVYDEMLPKIPLRFVLADDPGAGKTIMTGLLIKELIVREDMKRCLIVSPGGLTEQWKDELSEKFTLDFTVLSSYLLKQESVFEEYPFCIVSVDILARNEKFKEKLKETEWDLIVVDEAHKLSATVWGKEIKYSKRYQLGRLLSGITKNFLLLTATPHNGKSEDFELFMSLLDPDRFEGANRNKGKPSDVSDLMRRMVKESLLKFDGTPLFPNRFSYTAEYKLSNQEQELYEAVTDYVRHEFNRAERLEKSKQTAVGFALTILQRRLASSPEAIYQSLHRRKQKLKEQLIFGLDHGKRNNEIFLEDQDYPSFHNEQAEEQSFETASMTEEELQSEIRTLERLEKMAKDLRDSGKDRKWEQLSELIQNQQMINPETHEHEKLIIFTEHKDTLNYLKERLGTLLGSPESVLTISGATSRNDRRLAADIFKNDPEARILLATDAAGEGINLQNAHLMVNYDLPWNPNRLEQRFGRIHRIGQKHDCYLWNLCASNTREGRVYKRLLEKIDTEKEALGGKVFDILGKISFQNRSLSDLLLDAIRSDKEEIIFTQIDEGLNRDHLQKLIHQEAFAEEVMDKKKVFRIKEEMERAEAHKLQPHFIEAYFLELLHYFGGKAIPKGNGVYELKSVPFGETLPKRYQSVFFEPKPDVEGELISIGHPLLEMMMKRFLNEHRQDLQKELTLSDPEAEDEKVLYVFKGSIEDGDRTSLIDKIYFVLEQNGSYRESGYAPYLDYQKADQNQMIHSPISEQMTNDAKDFVLSQLMSKDKQKLQSERDDYLRKAERAVSQRLTREIQYWDSQAGELLAKDPLNSRKAQKRADELHERLTQRMDQFKKESVLSERKPELITAVRILPGKQKEINQQELTDHKRAIERKAMQAVSEIEKSLGNVPRDVSKENVGYDIESRSGLGNLRFIEVKGRQKGADTVTVSKNEILTALNKPDDYYLAIVEVNQNQTKTIYLKQPFTSQPEFSIASINYNIKDLIKQSKECIRYGTEEETDRGCTAA